MLSYRDRISVLTCVVALIFALQPAILAPAWELVWYPLGTPLAVRVDKDTLVGLFLVMPLVGGTQWLFEAWDLGAVRVSLREGWWSLPLTIGWLALRLLPYQPSPQMWLAVLGGTILVLALSWHALVYVATGSEAPFPAAFVVRVVSLVAAGVLYLWLYSLGARSLVSATQMWLGSTLLATTLWSALPLQPHRRWLYSLVTGAVIAQLAWALKQTTWSPFRSGLLLLLVFYITVSLVERALTREVPLRLLVEYAVTGFVGLILILAFAP